jgi:hypothetical protein
LFWKWNKALRRDKKKAAKAAFFVVRFCIGLQHPSNGGLQNAPLEANNHALLQGMR